MAMKIDRRAFLKTSAAMAVAVSMTGLLGGCSDGDSGTDLGGFTVAVGEWSAVPHDQGIGTGKSWYADFAVTVRVHNLDNSNGFSFPAKSVFVLKIDGLLLNKFSLCYQIFYAVSSELRLMLSTMLIIFLAESISSLNKAVILPADRNGSSISTLLSSIFPFATI